MKLTISRRKRLYEASGLVVAYFAGQGLLDAEASGLILSLAAIALGVARKNVRD